VLNEYLVVKLKTISIRQRRREKSALFPLKLRGKNCNRFMERI
jgi:hypothetical protein